MSDSKGNVYYSDLSQVWRMRNGHKSVVVPNVHTHQLFIDNEDNIFGEHLWYAGDTEKKFYHYYWRYNKDGRLDTISAVMHAYAAGDVSLTFARTSHPYYFKFNDSFHLYKASDNANDYAFANYDFRRVAFFQPQKTGQVFFSKEDTIFRIQTNGKVEVVAENLGSNGRSMLWGIWQDSALSTYVALFGEKLIKKVDSSGKIVEVYKSPKGWSPAAGLFDKHGRLWILEWADDNKVRAFMLPAVPEPSKKKNMFLALSVGVTVILLFGISYRQRSSRRNPNKKQSA